MNNFGANFTNITNTGVYTGSTSDTLKISSVTGLNNRQYRCIVSGTCSPVATSNTARLTVNTAPVIDLQPVSASICSGINVSFSTGAPGAGIVYQWQVINPKSSNFINLTNGGVYSGATTATLNISNDTGLDSTSYRCIISNLNCNITSNKALLRVLTAPDITEQPKSISTCSGFSASFSLTVTGSSLAYQWQSNAGGTYQNLTNGGVYSNVTSATLDISNVTGLNGISYECIITGCDSSVTISNPALLTVGNGAPAITLQPKSVAVCSGNSASFAVAVTGGDLSYQWQVNNTGVSFTNLATTSVYSGVSSDTLKISNVTGLNNRQYRCIIAGTCSPVAISNSASLTVNNNPAISIQPAPVTACSGTSVLFSVTASDGTLYMWQSDVSGSFENLNNGGIYSNVNTSAMNISDDTYLNNTNYRCIISNSSCNVTSNPALLTVLISPEITIQPKSVAVCDGSSTSLSITANGGNITYQWQIDTDGIFVNLIDSSVFNGSTSAKMNISNVSGLNGIYFRCVVTAL